MIKKKHHQIYGDGKHRTTKSIVINLVMINNRCYCFFRTSISCFNSFIAFIRTGINSE